jgi:hypothetical protein
MGYENQYYNIYNINKKYLYNLPKSLGIDTKQVTLSIIRNRINNLKQIIIAAQTIIYNVRNNVVRTTTKNTNEKQLIADAIKHLKKFNLTGESDNNIFKYYRHIIDSLSIIQNIPENIDIKLNKNYLNVDNLNLLNNTDIQLIFYLISNFSKLLDYNKENTLQIELARLIINIIKYLFNLYYNPKNDHNIRKFDFYLTVELPSDIERGSGYYQGQVNPEVAETDVSNYYGELLSKEDLNNIDEKKEENYNAKEEFDAFDVDDYVDEEDKGYDDIDNNAEAFDGYDQ